MSNFIIDVGFHKGEDTSFYLHKGYKVLAIEADPALITNIPDGLQQHVIQGQLLLMHSAISNSLDKTIDFHVSNHTVWNSLNYSISNRFNLHAQTKNVPNTSLAKAIIEYGVPYYCKIDIEGQDKYAIQSLLNDQLPQFISCESECYGPDDKLDHDVTLDTLMALWDKGYRKFKLVDQPTLKELTDQSHRFGKKESWWKPNERTRLSRRMKYTFPFGSSGPGPIDPRYHNPSTWMDYEKTAHLLSYYKRKKIDFDGTCLWMDIHATLSA